MRRSKIGPAVAALFLGGLATGAALGVEEGSGRPPEGLAARAMAIVEAVQEHHIAPPSRAEMIAAGILQMQHNATVQGGDNASRQQLGALSSRDDPELMRRVEEVKSAEQLGRLLEEFWPADRLSEEAAEAFLRGVSSRVPGDAWVMSDSERNARDQVAGNRYVGLQVAVAIDEDEGLVLIKEVFEGGPAERAGLLAEDRIEAIAGEPMRGVPFTEVLERLRGEEGTSVTLTARQPGGEPRTLEIRREALPRATVSVGEAEGSLPSTVAYLKIEHLAGSTLHELRKLEPTLASEGKRSLVLDLRGTRAEDPHPAALVADGLLDEGPIGSIRTVAGVQAYRSGPDCLFRGWPMAVLVDFTTSGPAEWLAAALKDRGRAPLIGMPTAGTPIEVGTVPLGGGGWLALRTGELRRVDDRPMREMTAEEIASLLGPLRTFLEERGEGHLLRAGIAEGLRPDQMVSPTPSSGRGGPRDLTLQLAIQRLGRPSDGGR